MTLLDAHRQDLDRLASVGRLRGLAPRVGRDFTSNDYLGLAQSPRLAAAARAAIDRGVSVGAGGSRLLRGNHEEHEALEAEAAGFFGTESALYFSSGFAANATLFSTLPQRGDLVVYDELIHASAHEGLRISRATSVAATHNDPHGVEQAIAKWRREGGAGRVWIAAETLYSMDGDMAPLGELAELAERHDAFLLLDEAHATGVFGREGRGLADELASRENVLTLRTCGKALGAEGALVCGPRVMREFLVNRGRGFIFSTAPSPLLASVVRESLRILVDEPDRRERLKTNVETAARSFGAMGIKATGSQILPVIVGEDVPTMRAAAALQQAGFDVRGIRPPTVPAGTSRLRISITLNVTPEDVESLAQAVGEALK